MSLAKAVHIISVSILLLAGIVFSQHLFDFSRTIRRDQPAFSLPPSVARVVDLGAHSAVASLLWLNLVQRVGEFKTRFLFEDLEVITSLDPRFSYPYAFGVLMLSFFDKMDKAVELGERGIREADPDWRIPYYLSVVYHTHFSNRARALELLEFASRTPGAPPGIQKVLAYYGTRPNFREETKALWHGIYENSRDEFVRKRAENFILHLEIIDRFEQAASLYRKKFGNYPQTPEDLLEAGILKEIPPSPLGFKYWFNKDGRVRIEN